MTAQYVDGIGIYHGIAAEPLQRADERERGVLVGAEARAYAQSVVLLGVYGIEHAHVIAVGMHHGLGH